MSLTLFRLQRMWCERRAQRTLSRWMLARKTTQIWRTTVTTWAAGGCSTNATIRSHRRWRFRRFPTFNHAWLTCRACGSLRWVLVCASNCQNFNFNFDSINSKSRTAITANTFGHPSTNTKRSPSDRSMRSRKLDTLTARITSISFPRPADCRGSTSGRRKRAPRTARKSVRHWTNTRSSTSPRSCAKSPSHVRTATATNYRARTNTSLATHRNRRAYEPTWSRSGSWEPADRFRCPRTNTSPTPSRMGLVIRQLTKFNFLINAKTLNTKNETFNKIVWEKLKLVEFIFGFRRS